MGDPGVISTWLNIAPFILVRNGTPERWPWIRVMDGQVTPNADRGSLIRAGSGLPIHASCSSLVPQGLGLPAEACWGAGRAHQNPRVALGWFGLHYDTWYRPSSTGDLRSQNVPAGWDGSTGAISAVRDSLEQMCVEMHTRLFVSFNDARAFELNPAAPQSSAVALLSFSEVGCRIAYWTEANVFPTNLLRRRAAVAIMEATREGDAGDASLTGRSTSACGRTGFRVWPEDTADLLLTVPTGSAMLEPQYAWAWHLLETGPYPCGVRGVNRILGVDQSSAGLPRLESDYALIQHGAKISGETTITTWGIGRGGVLYEGARTPTDPCQKRGGVMFCTQGHWLVGALPRPDDVDAYHPPRPSLLRSRPLGKAPVVHEADEPERLKTWDWKTLYLGADHGDLSWESWSSWEDIAGRLDMCFGAGYAHPRVTRPSEAGDDPRVAHLAGWASYHRTTVQVFYKGRTWFEIYPDYTAPAHHLARPGRKIVVELGHDGARKARCTLSRRGNAAVNTVFVGGLTIGNDLSSRAVALAAAGPGVGSLQVAEYPNLTRDLMVSTMGRAVCAPTPLMVSRLRWLPAQRPWQSKVKRGACVAALRFDPSLCSTSGYERLRSAFGKAHWGEMGLRALRDEVGARVKAGQETSPSRAELLKGVAEAGLTRTKRLQLWRAIRWMGGSARTPPERAHMVERIVTWADVLGYQWVT